MARFIYSLEEMQTKRAAALKEYFLMQRYINAEKNSHNDVHKDTYIFLYSCDKNEAYINYMFWNKQIKDYLKSIAH